MDRYHNNAAQAVTYRGRPKHRLLRAFVRLLECVFLCAGVLALLVFGLFSWERHSFQIEQSERLKNLEQTQTNEVAKSEQPSPLFGKISIPRLGVSAIVAEGVDTDTLRNAVGHFPGTSTPERPGTVALAGHRDTFFHPLADIRPGDRVILETAHGDYRYFVVRTFVVSPDDVEVLQPSLGSDLTLVTCFPFHYVGPAPKRFIVQAKRIAPALYATNRDDKNHPEPRIANRYDPGARSAPHLDRLRQIGAVVRFDVGQVKSQLRHSNFDGMLRRFVRHAETQTRLPPRLHALVKNGIEKGASMLVHYEGP